MNTSPAILPIQPMLPKIGSIVLITLNASLADRINQLPGNSPTGISAGEICPLIITRSCKPGCSCLMVNGRIISDTPANYRVVDVPYGKKPGHWFWPEIENAAELMACVGESTAPLKNLSGAGISPTEARLRDELITAQNNEQHFRQASNKLAKELEALRVEHANLERVSEVERDKLNTELSEVSSQRGQLAYRLNESRCEFDRINKAHQEAAFKLHEQEDQIRSLKQEVEAAHKNVVEARYLATQQADRAKVLEAKLATSHRHNQELLARMTSAITTLSTDHMAAATTTSA